MGVVCGQGWFWTDRGEQINVITLASGREVFYRASGTGRTSTHAFSLQQRFGPDGEDRSDWTTVTTEDSLHNTLDRFLASHGIS